MVVVVVVVVLVEKEEEGEEKVVSVIREGSTREEKKRERKKRNRKKKITASTHSPKQTMHRCKCKFENGQLTIVCSDCNLVVLWTWDSRPHPTFVGFPKLF